jgi:3-methyladenine DNA glycosylase/8-oxoguanine DNA glycosylase
MAKPVSSTHPAITHLKKVDPVLHKKGLPHFDDILKPTTHRRNYTALFASLAGSIVSQQLSVKAADTIWKRLEEKCKGSVTPEAISKLRITSMRAAGLSAAKCKTLKELSNAVLTGSIDFKKLQKMPEQEAIASLSKVWGIGTWTAEMFLIFALKREDIFSVGDLGLLRSMESLYGIPKDSPKQVYLDMSQKWSPHRSVASRLLWKIRDAN